MSRPRHPRKELEQVLQDLETHGWRVERRKKYYKAFCPCGLHATMVKMTPSGARYEINLRKRLERQPCWEN